MVSYAFGEDLRAQSATQECPRAGRVREECVETAIALNLRSLFPMWNLDLRQLSSAGWGVPDIVATDAIGTIHVFEIKDERSGAGLLEQALSYALTVSIRTPPDLWSNMLPTSNRALIAQRIAGFWTNERTDKLPSAEVPTSFRAIRRLEQLAKRTGRTMEHWLDFAARYDVQHQVPGWTPSDIHVHIVAEAFDDDIRHRASTLIERGARISLWKTMVRSSDSNGRQGHISVEPVLDEGRFLPASFLDQIAAVDRTSVAELGWAFQSHSEGRGMYANAPKVFGEHSGVAILQKTDQPFLLWYWTVPGFAWEAAKKNEVWAERIRKQKIFHATLADHVGRAVGANATIDGTKQQFRVSFGGEPNAAETAAAVFRSFRKFQSEAEVTLTFTDLPWPLAE